MHRDLEAARRALALVAAWTPRRLQDAMLALLAGPPLLDIEVSSSCNVRCAFCPREELRRPRTVMTPETFALVLAFVPAQAVVMFSGLGEPLLNPRLPEFVARLRARGISSCVITNGLLLTPGRLDALLAAGVDQIQVSCHATTDEGMMWAVTEGADFPRLLANLEHLAAVRPQRLRVQLDFVDAEVNAGELTSVAQLAQRLGFDLVARRRHTRGGLVGVRRMARACSGCGIFPAVTFITSEGGVSACSNDVRGATTLGHLATIDWPATLEWKRRVIRGGDWFEPCAACDDDYRWVILAQHGVDPA
ncbi:MAG TPA: radical SAM protein [Polyangia bacterium]|jgi:pyruvate-formate lyase-activating enzyme